MKLYHTDKEVKILREELSNNWSNLKRTFWTEMPIIKYIPKIVFKMTSTLEKIIKKIANR